MGQLVWSIIAVVGAFVMIGGVLFFMLTEKGDREREEAARVYFDEHGHWPDEPPPADPSLRIDLPDG
jgi:hypothetical protein